MQEQSKAVVADKATTKNKTKNSKAKQASNKVDVAGLLELANATTSTRVANTCKLYADKLNFAQGAGVEQGKRYACKVANNTMLVYADKNGNKASNKGDGIVFATGKAKHLQAYLQAFKASKQEGFKEHKDYSITKQTSNGVEYLIIDLQEHLPKNNNKGASNVQ